PGGDAAGPAGGGQAAPDPGVRTDGPRARRAPQVEITITGPDGAVVQTLRGPASPGIHKVTWNLRGAPEPRVLSPSERRDSVQLAERARVVLDSLIAAGWEEEPLRRQIGLFTGETDAASMFGGGGFGGGGAGRDPEEFQERPGESMGGGGRGGFDFGRMRELADIVRPGVGIGGLFRRGRGGQGPLSDPGTYTATLKVGERTFTQPLAVERVGSLTGESSPFEERPEERAEGSGRR
ncbi:MAG TPA: hypothetical protein VK849_11125, partial [Longimicrobiales bacterium]|nr:hypothetical protein [Longimicrobiales bacterium]